MKFLPHYKKWSLRILLYFFFITSFSQIKHLYTIQENLNSSLIKTNLLTIQIQNQIKKTVHHSSLIQKLSLLPHNIAHVKHLSSHNISLHIRNHSIVIKELIKKIEQFRGPIEEFNYNSLTQTTDFRFPKY